MGPLATQLLNGLTFAGLLFVVSSGFTLAYGMMRIVNLAHGSFYLVGGYLGAVTATRFIDNFLVSVVVGAVGTAALGFFTERVLLRRIRGQLQAEVLLTAGLSMVIADLALVIWGGTPRPVAPPSVLSGSVRILGVQYPVYRYMILLFAIALAVALFLLQDRTRLGARVRAGVDDREVLKAMGVNVDRIFSGVFLFGSALAGAAGVLGGVMLGLSPGGDTQILIYALVVVILGGTGSLGGAAIGSAVVGIVDVLGKVYAPDFAYFTLFVPMLLVLAFRPAGLLGRR